MKEMITNEVNEVVTRWGHNKFTTIVTSAVGAALITIAVLSNVIPNDEPVNNICKGED